MTIVPFIQPNALFAFGGEGGGVIMALRKKTYGSLKSIRDSYDGSCLLSDMNASLGLSQFKELDNFIDSEKVCHLFSGAALR